MAVELRFTLMNGNRCVISADCLWRVSRVKAKLEQEVGIPQAEQQLIHESRQLHSSDVLGWHFADGCMADLTLIRKFPAVEWLTVYEQNPLSLLQLDSGLEPCLRRGIRTVILTHVGTDRHVAFQLRTTAPNEYFVRPAKGVLTGSGTQQEVQILRKDGSNKVAPQHKFLVQAVVSASAKPLAYATWSSFPQHLVHTQKFLVDFSGSNSEHEETSSQAWLSRVGHLAIPSLQVEPVARPPAQTDGVASGAAEAPWRSLLLTQQNSSDYVAFRVLLTQRASFSAKPARGVLSGKGCRQEVKITQVIPTSRQSSSSVGPRRFRIQAVARNSAEILDAEAWDLIPQDLIQEYTFELDFSNSYLSASCESLKRMYADVQARLACSCRRRGPPARRPSEDRKRR
mmetsp:Transcript_59240/g.93988  ORF Transcript_59240/g.93988 Transcript_59240/m.93988 type:complete len:399 (+) Transcript_59240:139-1335(+)